MLSDETLAFGEKIMPAILGVDALYRAESKDGERSTFWTLRLESLISRVKRG